MVVRFFCICLGYIFGLFQTGYLYGKANNIDIREHGSGNLGATNALRTLGKKGGIITFLGDSIKCVAAITLVRVLFSASHGEIITILALYTGVGTVLGHAFPFYLGFKGGKGIATSVGLVLAINFWIALIAAVCFFVVVTITKYVSVSSMILMAVFASGMIAYAFWGGFDLGTQQLIYELSIIVTSLFAFTVYKHKDNIVRLKNGTENKIGSKK